MTIQNIIENCIIHSERRFIDLEIWIPQGDETYRAIVVEAKLRHKITKNQLKTYYDRVSSDEKLTSKKGDFIVLAMDEGALADVPKKQKANWRFVAWHDVWLQFVKSRPKNDDLSLALFLNAVWQKIQKLK